MNKQIFSHLGTIGASPYMISVKRLNTQYSRIETSYEKGRFTDCVADSSQLFEQLMQGLYLAVTGERAQLGVILSDIGFWDVIGNKMFCDTAGMLHYACYRLTEDPESEMEPAKAASLAKSGLDDVIGYMAQFLAKQGKKKCLPPEVLERDDVREQVLRLTDSLRTKMESAGCRDGVSMQPPFMNACLLDFPEGETGSWARYIARKLQSMGFLSSSEVRVLDADRVVTERVGLTNEFIRRASAGANGGALLVEHFEEFDMPCLGGNLLDRALKTVINAAEMYRGSLAIIVAGQGENVEKAFRRAERCGEYFPLALSLRAES